MKSSLFSADYLPAFLRALPGSGPYFVAYSGGLDSHVLLHALCSVKSQLGADVHALHVNHGISTEADRWASHCENTCATLKIEYTLLKFDEVCPDGESMEAWARKLRYQLMDNEISAEGVLLTAHHQDDQAETLLLQMIRGSGVKGLASMPMIKKSGDLWHARPLLNTRSQQLLDYARGHGLQWIEDESNSNIAYDRNFLRRKILPVLQQRWPAVNRTLARAASHQADSLLLLDDLAEIDLQLCLEKHSGRLNTGQLSVLALARQANVVRYWLRHQHLPVPDTSRMQQVLDELLHAREDASPVVTWTGCEIRRYQSQLYASKPLPGHNASIQIDWTLDSPCQLGDSQLSAKLGKSPGIKASVCPNHHLQVRYRQGGERIKLGEKRCSRELKKLFQEEGIPPWLRNRIPLLYADDVLVAVADLWIDVVACSGSNESAWQIHWTGLKNSTNANRGSTQN